MRIDIHVIMNYNITVVKGAGGKEAAMKWTDWQQLTREQKQAWLDQIKAAYKKKTAKR